MELAITTIIPIIGVIICGIQLLFTVELKLNEPKMKKLFRKHRWLPYLYVGTSFGSILFLIFLFVTSIVMGV